MNEHEPWNVYENQQSRFTFNSIANCLGQAARQQPGQGGVVVMYDPSDEPFVAFDSNYSGRGDITNDGTISPTVKIASSTGGNPPAIATSGTRTIVRRLTPLECERLMGWADNYTLNGIDDDGNFVTLTNTNRYRICGNGIVASVTQWIGERLP